MRSFDDEQGRHWQAALMNASFGDSLLVFSRIGAEGVLKKALDTVSVRESERLLAEADETRLRALLAQAEPWT